LARENERIRDSLQRAELALPVVARRGELTISSTGSLSKVAEAALVRFDGLRQRYFGNAMPSRLGFRIALRQSSASAPFWLSKIDSASLVLSGAPDAEGAPRASPLLSRREVADPEVASDYLLRVFGRLMLARAPPAVQRWVDADAAFGLSDDQRRAETMYGLVTGAGPAQRRCVGGVLRACASAMGLVAGEAGPFYYQLMRADLLLTALEIGGPGAWNRLASAPGESMSDALAAASRMPIDSLLGSWRDGLLARRPASRPLGGVTVMVFAGWSALLLVIALGAARWV
jgi:hypothetical protein